ncbi:MAG: hypothetical protein IPJ82_08635 [Lewinellaceae bacterium]|nr:hypothetical protein [Lewinellaceae bacterium]
MSKKISYNIKQSNLEIVFLHKSNIIIMKTRYSQKFYFNYVIFLALFFTPFPSNAFGTAPGNEEDATETATGAGISVKDFIEIVRTACEKPVPPGKEVNITAEVKSDNPGAASCHVVFNVKNTSEITTPPVQAIEKGDTGEQNPAKSKTGRPNRRGKTDNRRQPTGETKVQDSSISPSGPSSTPGKNEGVDYDVLKFITEKIIMAILLLYLAKKWSLNNK